MADFNPGHEPKTAHLFYDLPRGSRGLRWLLDERILPPQGGALDLNVGDVIDVRVRSDGPTSLPARGHSGDRIKGSGQHRSPELRFEVSVNGSVVATIGNPDAGGLSVDLAVIDRDEKVQISLHATGSDDTGFRHWAGLLLFLDWAERDHEAGPSPPDVFDSDTKAIAAWLLGVVANEQLRTKLDKLRLTPLLACGPGDGEDDDESTTFTSPTELHAAAQALYALCEARTRRCRACAANSCA